MPFSGNSANLERTLSLLGELADLGVFSLLISGGEPTIHPGILEIAEVAASRFALTAMNTNGIRHSNVRFAEAFSAVAANMLVTISLDAVDPAINNLGRGAGGAKALSAVRNCARLGQPVCVSAVVTRESAPHAVQLVELLRPWCNAFRFSPIIPRSEAHEASLGAGYMDLVEKCFDELRARFEDNDIQLLLPKRRVEQRDIGDLHKETACVCASTKLFINEKLECYPCYYSASPTNLLGDASTESLTDIWFSPRARTIRSRAQSIRLCGVDLNSGGVPDRYRPEP